MYVILHIFKIRFPLGRAGLQVIALKAETCGLDES